MSKFVKTGPLFLITTRHQVKQPLNTGCNSAIYLNNPKRKLSCLHQKSPQKWVLINTKIKCTDTTKLTFVTYSSSSSSETINEHQDCDDNKFAELFEKLLETDDYRAEYVKVLQLYADMPQDIRPSHLSIVDIDYLIKMDSERLRKTHIKRLRRSLDKGSEEKLLKSEKPKEKFEILPPSPYGSPFDYEGKISYKTYQNSILCSYDYKNRKRILDYQKVVHSYILNEARLVIDLSYEEYLSPKQLMVLASQIIFSHTLICNMKNPASLYLCNLDKFSRTFDSLQRSWRPDLGYFYHTPKSYLDIFPKEKLVYLTAHTDTILDFNPDDIWIVGGMIDIGTTEPLSAIKAREEGLRTAKLPQELLQLRNSEKSLNMSHIVGAMCDLIDSEGKNNLVRILSENVPQFKQISDEEIQDSQRRIANRQNIRVNRLQEKYNLTVEELKAIRAFGYFWGHNHYK